MSTVALSLHRSRAKDLARVHLSTLLIVSGSERTLWVGAENTPQPIVSCCRSRMSFSRFAQYVTQETMSLS
jgi:hypothetical protein